MKSKLMINNEKPVSRHFGYLMVILICALTPKQTFAISFIGTTDTHLVSIEVLGGGITVTPIGPHGLSPDFRIFDITLDHDQNRIIGLVTSNQGDPTSASQAQFLYSFDLTTGQAQNPSKLTDGKSDQGFYESIGYSRSHGLILSQITPSLPDFSSRFLTPLEFIENGLPIPSAPSLSDTGRDNDRGLFVEGSGWFGGESNDSVQRWLVPDVNTGTPTVLGTGSFIGTMAHDEGSGLVFSATSNDLYTLDPNNNFNFTLVGTIPGDSITGLAAAPNVVPEPITATLGVVGLVALGHTVTRRRVAGTQ